MKWIAVLLGLTAAVVTWTVIKPLDQAPAVVVTPGSVPLVSAKRQTEATENLTDAASPPNQPPVIERTDELGGDDPYSSSKAATELAINSYINSKLNNKYLSD